MPPRPAFTNTCAPPHQLLLPLCTGSNRGNCSFLRFPQHRRRPCFFDSSPTQKRCAFCPNNDQRYNTEITTHDPPGRNGLFARSAMRRGRSGAGSNDCGKRHGFGSGSPGRVFRFLRHFGFPYAPALSLKLAPDQIKTLPAAPRRGSAAVPPQSFTMRALSTSGGPFLEPNAGG